MSLPLPIFNQVWICNKCNIHALPTLFINCTLPLSNWWNMGEITELLYLSVISKLILQGIRIFFFLSNPNMKMIWSVLRISASSCWLNIVFFCIALLNKILERNNNMAETAVLKTYGWTSYFSKTVHWFKQLVKNV